MRLGLGSGRAVWGIARGLGGSAVRPELVVCASPETARLVAASGIPVASPEEAPELDLALDGADEVTRELTVLKGGGGALLREKLVIESAARCVIVAETRQAGHAPGRGLAPAGRGRPLRLGGHARAPPAPASPMPAGAARPATRRSSPTRATTSWTARSRPGPTSRPWPRPSRPSRASSSTGSSSSTHRRRSWGPPTARSSDWSGRELHRVPRVDVRRDHFLDDALVLGMIRVDAEGVHVVERRGRPPGSRCPLAIRDRRPWPPSEPRAASRQARRWLRRCARPDRRARRSRAER